MDDVAQVSMAGVLAVMIIREVLTQWRRRPTATAAASVNLDPVLGRLDRVIDRLDDIADTTRDTRQQAQITSEQTARLCRAMTQLEAGLHEHRAAHRRHEPTPV